MTDLSKGIVEIDEFTIKPGTTLEEMQSFFGDKVRVLDLSTGPRLKFQKPYYLTESIYAYAFNFNNDGVLSNFSLIPEVPDTVVDHGYGEIPKYKVNASKQWLKGMIEEPSSSESNESISYAFNWGYIRSATRDDIHYGLVGGEIVICYEV